MTSGRDQCLASIDPKEESANTDDMQRVLLVVDDYRELVFLQTLLKKMGFDVDGTQNLKKYEDLKLALNPDLIIASSKGKAINGLKMAEELKRPQGIPKFILIVPHKMAQKVFGLQLKNVDGSIDSPIDAKKLLTTVAKVMGIDADPLIEKYNKMMTHLDADQESDLQILKSGPLVESEDQMLTELTPRSVSSGLAPSVRVTSISSEDRAQRMAESLKNLEVPPVNGFAKDVVHQWNKRIRDEEAKQDLKDLEDERQAFVKTLFTKPSS
jgi:response regulator RpfG family c-di-GMP phosphodiesterase